jgi:replication-associated recombination protein RarA
VGHEKAKKALLRMRDNGSLGGRAFWLSGPSGIGKTSMAYLIAADVCDEDNFIEIDAGGMTPKDIDDLEKQLRMRCLGEKSGRAILVNEAHGLRQDSIRKLLVVLERIPGHVTWVFTTTDVGKEKLFKDIDAHPLLSRCIKFELTVDDYADAMVKRAMAIAEQEGLGGAKREEWVELAVACKWNFRDVLTEVEKGVMVRDVPAVVAEETQSPEPFDFAAMMDEMFASA